MKKTLAFIVMLSLTLSLLSINVLADENEFFKDFNSDSTIAPFVNWGATGTIVNDPHSSGTQGKVMQVTSGDSGQWKMMLLMKNTNIGCGVVDDVYIVELKIYLPTGALNGGGMSLLDKDDGAYGILAIQPDGSGNFNLVEGYWGNAPVAANLTADTWHTIKIMFKYKEAFKGSGTNPGNSLLKLWVDSNEITNFSGNLSVENKQLYGMGDFSGALNNGDGRVSFRIFNPANTTVYMDDVCIKRVLPPSVKEIVYGTANDRTSVAHDDKITIKFTGDIDSTTLTNQKIILRNAITCENLAYTGNFNSSTNEYTIDLASINMMGEATYNIIIDENAVYDIYGTAVARASYPFTAALDTDNIVKDINITNTSGLSFDVDVTNATGAARDVKILAALIRKSDNVYCNIQSITVNIDALDSSDGTISFGNSSYNALDYIVRFMFVDDDFNALTQSRKFEDGSITIENN